MVNRDPKAEKRIGDKAADMLQRAIRSEVRTFKSHMHQQEKNLKNTKALGYGHDWVGKLGDTMFELDGIKLNMPRHGYVQQFGINASSKGRGVRKRHKVERKIPRFTKYYRGRHYVEMDANQFISRAIEKSRVVNFLLQELVKVKGKRVFIGMSSYINDETRKQI
ncbi:hypothetical protein ACT4R9_05690 [Ornithobacterium rhinotracheale]|uniref:hypothetical protein n=1 Tax=Ornithobacterium rhinotracheale TaxID=28251 RepID=UPI003FA4C238